MTLQFDAIFDNGVFKPFIPVSLPDKTRVTIHVESKQIGATTLEPRDEWEHRLLCLAKDCGVSLSDAVFGSEGL
jgi:predicted DNA-binding antitoxin AbrB/MazE fold protein